MLTILVGSDTKARAKRLDALLSSYKKNGAEILFYDDMTFNADELRAKAGSISLFGTESICVISGAAENAQKREELESVLENLAQSPSRFFISEQSLLAPFLKLAKKYGADVEEFKEKEKIKKAEAFNSFLLTDAYSSRKRAMAWALYRSAISHGIEPRELHGKIFWSVKTLLLARDTENAADAGLHPFVYGKAKVAAKNFKDGELESQAGELAVLFHESLVSGIDLETSLEAFILRSLAKSA